MGYDMRVVYTIQVIDLFVAHKVDDQFSDLKVFTSLYPDLIRPNRLINLGLATVKIDMQCHGDFLK